MSWICLAHQADMKKALADAKESACKEIAKNVPLIMYGSGATMFDATNLVSALTVDYIVKLVDSAMECAEYEFPNQQRLPPKLPKAKKKRRCFDDPLPPPKIRKDSTETTKQHTPKEPYVESNAAWDATEPKWIIPDDHKSQWKGALGLDMWQSHRRPRSVTGLSSQHVLFSLCQDTYVYGRIREAQADKETILTPYLIDPVIRETLTQQAKLLHEEERISKQKDAPKKKNAVRFKASEGSDDEEDEDEVEEQDEEDRKPAWPSLDGILPVRESFS